MSERGERGSVRGSTKNVVPYEPPTLVVLGNARDLLAGSAGSADDSFCSVTSNTRPGGSGTDC
jgi:hypothetical protein